MRHAVQRWQVGNVTVTRIVEQVIPLTPDVLPIGRDPAALLQTPWGAPDGTDGAGRFLFGFSICCLESEGHRMVIDPGLAFDPRLAGEGGVALADSLLDAALPEAGWAPESVQTVVNSHVDGLGWNLRPHGDTWVPAFPDARVLFPAGELARMDGAGDSPEEVDQKSRLRLLADAGVLTAVEPDLPLTAEVHLEASAVHMNAGMDIRIVSDGAQAVFAGHTLLNPLQVADPDFNGLDEDPARSPELRRAWLQRCVDEDVLVIGPHFGGGGAGRIRADGDGFRYAPEPGQA